MRTVLQRCARFTTSSAAARVAHAASADGSHGVFTLGTAKLTYHATGQARVIDIDHTLVPPEMRGRGVAEVLCEAAFAHARSASLRVVPSCSYVATRFVPRNVDSVGDVALASLDTSVAGLQIETRHDGVATLRLTDARRRNPLHDRLLVRMRDWLRGLHGRWPEHEGADADADADGGGATAPRCVVIEAEGPAFSAGHDFGDFHGATAADARRVLDVCAEVASLLQAIPQVSVAAVSGAALAGGAQLAASCDLVLAHADLARFELTGVHGRGFCTTPVVGYLGRLAPRAALELGVLGESVDASEAVRLGLANRAVPADAWRSTVDGLARRLASNFNRNVADGKRALYGAAAAPTLGGRYAVATPTMVEMMGSDNWQQHMRRFTERKAAPTPPPPPGRSADE